MKFAIILLLCFLFNIMEARERRPPTPLPLTMLHLIDRNGMTETLQTKERLEQYQNTDFLKSQPYQKVMRNYAKNKRGETLSLITSYYPNGQIKQYLELINNSAYGPYWEWHENGQPKLHAFVIGGMGDLGPTSERSWLFEGISKAWSEDGTLLCEIPYEKGIMSGVSVYYHSSGYINKKIPLKEGKIEGCLEKYEKGGALLESISYKDGKRDGQSTILYPGGNKAALETYKEGALMTGVYFDKEGIEIAEVEEGLGKQALFEMGRLQEIRTINEGIPEGEVLQYDDAGLLICKYHIKDGEKNGEETEYYPYKRGKEPKPRLMVSWYQDKIQGVVKTWYPNGRQESKREMSDNKKNGWLTAWYEDGAIMMIEEYDADVLKKGTYFKKGEKTPVSEIREGKGVATLFDSQGNYLKKITYQQGHPKE